MMQIPHNLDRDGIEHYRIEVERMLNRAQEEGRADDTPEVIARRLEIYHGETEPLIQHYMPTGRVVGIHADRSINEVWAEIQRVLEQADAA